MYSDPIADLLTRIRNASRAGNTTVAIPHSRIKESISTILEQKGIIDKARVDRSHQFPEIIVSLKEGKKKIELQRISKPGQRVYIKSTEIKPVRNGYGIAVISTSAGLMTGEDAKVAGVGGEYLCEIY